MQEVFHERVKTYKTWKDDEATLAKKREAKARLELAHKTDKISAATHEISEVSLRVPSILLVMSLLDLHVGKFFQQENAHCSFFFFFFFDTMSHRKLVSYLWY